MCPDIVDLLRGTVTILTTDWEGCCAIQIVRHIYEQIDVYCTDIYQQRLSPAILHLIKHHALSEMDYKPARLRISRLSNDKS